MFIWSLLSQTCVISMNNWEWGNPIDKALQTNPDSRPRSEPALELHRRAVSSVGITSQFQQSQNRKQFRKRADHKKLWPRLLKQDFSLCFWLFWLFQSLGWSRSLIRLVHVQLYMTCHQHHHQHFSTEGCNNLPILFPWCCLLPLCCDWKWS